MLDSSQIRIFAPITIPLDPPFPKGEAKYLTTPHQFESYPVAPTKLTASDRYRRVGNQILHRRETHENHVIQVARWTACATRSDRARAPNGQVRPRARSVNRISDRRRSPGIVRRVNRGLGRNTRWAVRSRHQSESSCRIRTRTRPVLIDNNFRTYRKNGRQTIPLIIPDA